jgi:hypothetical protein
MHEIDNAERRTTTYIPAKKWIEIRFPAKSSVRGYTATLEFENCGAFHFNTATVFRGLFLPYTSL